MTKAKAHAAEESAKTFDELGAIDKIAYIGKVVVFLITFGFAFPTIFGD